MALRGLRRTQCILFPTLELTLSAMGSHPPVPRTLFFLSPRPPLSRGLLQLHTLAPQVLLSPPSLPCLVGPDCLRVPVRLCLCSLGLALGGWWRQGLPTEPSKSAPVLPGRSHCPGGPEHILLAQCSVTSTPPGPLSLGSYRSYCTQSPGDRTPPSRVSVPSVATCSHATTLLCRASARLPPGGNGPLLSPQPILLGHLITTRAWVTQRLPQHHWPRYDAHGDKAQ